VGETIGNGLPASFDNMLRSFEVGFTYFQVNNLFTLGLQGAGSGKYFKR
jgi:hypothetical protein